VEAVTNDTAATYDFNLLNGADGTLALYDLKPLMQTFSSLWQHA